MRMWMVDPELLCRRHLLGEHVECHMFRGSLHRGSSLAGFVETGLLDSRLLAARHDELADEMLRRGYRHNSPLIADFDEGAATGDVNVRTSLRELAARCEECRILQSARRAALRASRSSERPPTTSLHSPPPKTSAAPAPLRGSLGHRGAR